LHRNGSSVDPRGRDGFSPLNAAAWYGDLEMLQVLLDYGVDVNSWNDFRATPLHFATGTPDGFSNARVIGLLLDRGADPNVRLWEGTTPLHNASVRGRIEMVRLLVEHGASVEVQDD